MSELRSFILQSVDLVCWLDERIGDFEVPSSTKTRLSLACIELTRQHHRAIIRLCENHLVASAAAMLRVLFESYAKSLWLFHCATDQDLNRYVNGDEVKISRIIYDIEKVDHYNTGVLAETKSAWWSKMCSFSHSGIEATGRQIDGEFIRPSFELEEIKHILEFSDSIALMAAIHIAIVKNDVDMSKAILEPAQRGRAG